MDNDFEEIDAGHVGPSTATYVVTYAHRHPSLVKGDAVVMTDGPNSMNYLFRTRDATLHKLYDEHDQYVHLRKINA